VQESKDPRDVVDALGGEAKKVLMYYFADPLWLAGAPVFGEFDRDSHVRKSEEIRRYLRGDANLDHLAQARDSALNQLIVDMGVSLEEVRHFLSSYWKWYPGEADLAWDGSWS